jgi:hypothetical protein
MRKSLLPLVLVLAILLASCGAPSYDDGYDDGWNEGYEAGIAEAYEQGVDDGYYVGYADGVTDAHSLIVDYVRDYYSEAHRKEHGGLQITIDDAVRLLYELELYTNVPDEIRHAAYVAILYVMYTDRLPFEIEDLSIPK